MTNKVDYVGHVKVKTAELKTHLSHYLRLVQTSEEPIEVCVREQPVAYLCKAEPTSMKATHTQELAQLQRRLAAVGLTLVTENAAGSPLPEIKTLPAGDGRTDIVTVESMRAERDW
jgi:antitoxin (DNA-binding transcriptional repressor) of toxin-antitoxin stability system